MSELRIPLFISERFKRLRSKKEKDELVLRYNDWRKHSFTQDLLKYLEKELEKEIQAEENKSFVSSFLFKYSLAETRGVKKTLRKIVRSIK